MFDPVWLFISDRGYSHHQDEEVHDQPAPCPETNGEEFFNFVL